MASGSPVSGLEVAVAMLGAIFIAIWAWRAVYRKLVASYKNKVLSLLSGGLAACILVVVWFVLVIVAFSPEGWLSTSLVMLVTGAIFYSTWRYTRVAVTAETALAMDGSTPVKAQNQVLKLLRDEYALIRDAWRDRKSARSPQAISSTQGADSWEASIIPALYEFDYAKEDGEITSRRVYVQSTSYSGGRQYLEGICKTRNARRTFRVDRVIGSMTRVDDGKMLRASELFARSTPSPITLMPSSSPTRKREWETAVFFAGFGSAKRSELEELAEAAGWQVRSSITKTVDYVVTGSMVGGAQLAKAWELGIGVLDEEGFRRVV